MKWIRASENEPPLATSVPYRELMECIEGVNRYAYGELLVFEKTISIDGDLRYKESYLENLEWLDESQASDKDKAMLGLVQDIERIGNESLIFEMDLKDAKQEIERLKGLIESLHTDAFGISPDKWIKYK